MKKIVDTFDTYFLNNIYMDIDTLTSKYSNYAKKLIIGKSVEDRDIAGVKVGINDSNPSILLIGGIHAREDFSVMLVMKMLDYILYNLHNNKVWGEYDIYSIISKINIFFIPTLNPDGLNIVHSGLKSSNKYSFLKKLKLHGNKSEYWKANANGVDLNMNFDDGSWYKKLNKKGVKIFASEGYKGIKPDSEPEVIAIKKLCEEQNFILSISYHCSGEVVFWADEGTHGEFKGVDNEIIDKFINYSGYKKTKVSTNPSRYACGFENWFRQRFKRPSYCIELSPFPGESYIQHEDNKFNELVWDKVKYSALLFSKEAIRLSSHMYNVYSDSFLLRTFYNKSDAMNYQKKHPNIEIRDVYNNII